jgi:hypothetical protein
MSVFRRLIFALVACPAFVPARAAQVDIEAALTRDDNVNRADSSYRQSDTILGVNAGAGTAVLLSPHLRAVMTGSLAADRYQTHSGLNRLSAGARGELQYRPSGHFFAPTFGLFARVDLDNTRSALRDGRRFAFGVSAREALTDRIDVFGALERRVRDAKSDVFDVKDRSARFNLDYALARKVTLYLGGEYRRGDVVSSVAPSAESASISSAWDVDDAFDGSLLAYRYDAKTTVWTLGGNWALAPGSSIDFSARRATSTPTSEPYVWPPTPGSGYSGTTRYTANIYSLAYLMRF